MDKEETKAVDEAFELSQEISYREIGKAVAIIGFLTYTSFLAVDWYLYPDSFRELAIARLSASAVLFATIFLVDILQGKILFRTGLVVATVPALAIVCMTYYVGGGTSPYYAGIILVFIFSAMAMPWHYIYNVISISISVAAYVFVSYYYDHTHTTPSDYWTQFASNFIFLTTTSGICLYVSIGQYFQRRENFLLRYKLEKKNREAIKLSQAKTEFFSNMSHELRTPLTLILGPLRDVLHSKEKMSPKANSLLNTAQSNGLRLLRLVNDLLDVMRLEEGEGLNSEAIEMFSLVEGLVESIAYAAASKEIELVLSCKAEDVWVDGDRGAIDKVLMNLLSNALKFTPAGGRVTVDCQHDEDFWQLSIEDTGIGIDAANLPHIFERFQQGDGSTTRTYTGTGIGLSLVKELVETMGGKVSADSTLGQGTTMRIWLPYWSGERPASSVVSAKVVDAFETMHSEAQDAAFGSEESSVTDELPYRESLATVLIIDDEPAMRKYLGDILADDYNVIRAVDGEEGLKLARSVNPELILLDLMIPKVDGLEVCRRLKKEDAEVQSKIVLLTARVDEEAKLTALENGADDFLTKPFGAVELKSRLGNLLQSAQLERNLSTQNDSLSNALGDLKQTQSQLIHSEKLNALGSLSAGLLHEINNPLNYSIAALHLMKMESLYETSSDFAELVDDVDNGMERIRVIVSDLRAFAYPSESDKKVIFSIEKAIETALRFTVTELGGAVVETKYCEHSQVLGSQSHIVQVLVNLIVNGSKAIQSKESGEAGKLTITTEYQDGRLLVRVQDNGVGMDAETQGRIFEPFFTTREVGKGVGLGLSVCHTIIQNHEGNLRAESDLGEGTTFIFDLESAQ